jgi:NADP-dependent 3-hydroxy acid dehydrogenase YdfG
MKLDHQTILITGASSGIGRATAVALSAHTNRIVITARRKELLESAAIQIEDNGSECLQFAGDATEEKFCAEVVAKTVERYGDIDIVLLNIGAGPPSNTLTAAPETIKQCMRTNYDTMINFYCPIVDRMKQQSGKCMIAHVNSQASYFGIPMQGDYTASKGAARLFLETARMELRHFGYKHIRIQTIHPGFVDTEACKEDGIPEPNVISEQQAAGYILSGLKNEMDENLFPPSMRFAVRLGQHIPRRLLARLLLKQTPKDF